jgi:multiple sugar transport system substrate-binding protein
MNKTVKTLILVAITVLLGWYIWSLITHKQNVTDSNVLHLWVAPAQDQEKFWEEATDAWNKSGQGMKVVFKTIPTAQSSEEAIFNSVASRTTPDICTNIFSGFGAQLSSLGAIYNLKEFKGYDELIKKRKMQIIMKRWATNDENYVLPIYNNPSMYGWRWDVLQKLGWKDVPKTYSDIYKLGEQVYVPNKKFPVQVLSQPTWWSRWWDFITLYYAASDGKPYISDNKAVFNNQYGKDVMNFIDQLYKKGYTPKDTITDENFYLGNVMGIIFLPKTISKVQQNYPKLLDKIKLGLLPVPDNHKGEVYSLADSKGLIIFKNTPHPEEAWKFVKWVFSQDKLSLLWLEYTTMLPARGDLLENPVFKDYLKENRFTREYAKYVNLTIPSALITKTIDIQSTMTNSLIEPIKYQTESVDKALQNTVNKINKALAAKY